MNRRDIKSFDLFDMGTTVNAYGQSSYNATKTCSVNGIMVEKERYAAVDNAASLISNYLLLSDYHDFKPGQIIKDGTTKYKVTSCTNSTRYTQVYLIKEKA